MECPPIRVSCSPNAIRGPSLGAHCRGTVEPLSAARREAQFPPAIRVEMS